MVVIPFPRSHEPYWHEVETREKERRAVPSDRFYFASTMAFCALLSCAGIPLIVLLVIGVFQ